MKTFSNLLAAVLILFGVLVLGYQGFTYNKRENVAQIGSLEINATQQRTVYFSPWVGGGSLVVGVILLLANRKKTY